MKTIDEKKNSKDKQKKQTNKGRKEQGKQKGNMILLRI